MNPISPGRLHEFWKTIESIPSSEIVSRNDVDLVNWLTERLGWDNSLSNPEIDRLKLYLNSRILLIRDLALEIGSFK